MMCISLQYYTDANEAESWIREKMPLVCSKDFGKDEPTSQVATYFSFGKCWSCCVIFVSK